MAVKRDGLSRAPFPPVLMYPIAGGPTGPLGASPTRIAAVISWPSLRMVRGPGAREVARSDAARQVDAVVGRCPAKVVDLSPLGLHQQIVAGVAGCPQRVVRVRQTLVDRRRELAHYALPSRVDRRVVMRFAGAELTDLASFH